MNLDRAVLLRLPTARHSAEGIASLFAPFFTTTHNETRVHHTPSRAANNSPGS